MKRLLAVALLVLIQGCSGSGTCNYDTDCPDSQICLDGTCQEFGVDPCETVHCAIGEHCVNGSCVPVNPPDAGQPDGNQDPCALVQCGPGQECRNGQCVNVGSGCVDVSVDPKLQAPFACDPATPCDNCATFQGKNYFCRRLNQGPFAFMIIPDEIPCDPDHDCDLLECNATFRYCRGAERRYIDGTIPTADNDVCNGLDDNCDGLTDESAVDFCPPVSDGIPACIDGVCTAQCSAGMHYCGSTCVSDDSPDHCGTSCNPCPKPDNGVATCLAGTCGIECLDGFSLVGGQCVEACDTVEACGPNCDPCYPGESCCDGECVETSDDPLNCGGCGWSCGAADYTCCDGQLCCAPESSECCGNFCCDNDGYCCPGNYCCPAGGSCCGEYCCAPPYTTCCPEGCCQTGSSCCNDFCCPGSHPICCSNGCCPSGTYCCYGGTMCCDKKKGSVPVPVLPKSR